MPLHCIAGTGISLGERRRPDGTRTSALRFTTGDRLSPLGDGRGYWRYIPTPDGVRFITGYDYRPGWGHVADSLGVRWLVGSARPATRVKCSGDRAPRTSFVWTKRGGRRDTPEQRPRRHGGRIRRGGAVLRSQRGPRTNRRPARCRPERVSINQLARAVWPGLDLRVGSGVGSDERARS